jgi:hypothetical protein
MSITLEGLTEQQRQIADLIWNCDTQADVDQLIRSLPPAYKQDAETVHELMIAAVMDSYEGVTEDVKDLISRICS